MLNKFKPVTPGLRGTILVSKKHLSSEKPVKSLSTPLNSTGDAVQTNHPLMHSKSLYRRKNQQDTKRLYKLLKKRYN